MKARSDFLRFHNNQRWSSIYTIPIRPYTISFITSDKKNITRIPHFRTPWWEKMNLIPYGIMNYAELIQEGRYFIDKTQYIADLEPIKNPVFLRPRRFGKSLFCSMLQYYYDIHEASRFSELFGQTWIGKNPTSQHNSYIVLKFDFSAIPISDNLKDIVMND